MIIPKVRNIPNTHEILAFLHCANCAPDKPADQSPREWARLEVGLTKLGLQVWCKRCNCNVVHIDFQGNKHPANLTRPKKLPESRADGLVA